MQLLTVAVLVTSLAVVYSYEDFSCTATTSYVYPVPHDCRSYYVCVKGSTKRLTKSCSWFFHNFDPVTLKCKWCWLVDCSAKPTPPQPPPPKPTSNSSLYW